MPIIKVNNVRLNYEQSGVGKPIVFLHGYTGSGNDWANQIRLFSPQYRVITIDHRGQGKSEAPKTEADYSIPIFCRDVSALLGKLEIKQCCLVGHSMGGFIALQLVLDHPELVKALVLVDTSSGEVDMGPGHNELRAKLGALARNEGLEAAFEYDAAHNPIRIERFQKHPELREIARQRVLSTSLEGYIYAARAISKWKPVTTKLNEINVPTLIFVGEEDTPFMRPTQILNDAIEEAELITVPGAGHSPHEEAADFFNEALSRFLSKIKWS